MTQPDSTPSTEIERAPVPGMGTVYVKVQYDAPMTLTFKPDQGVFNVQTANAIFANFASLGLVAAKALQKAADQTNLIGGEFVFAMRPDGVSDPEEVAKANAEAVADYVADGACVDEPAGASVDPVAHRDDQADKPAKEETNDVK